MEREKNGLWTDKKELCLPMPWLRSHEGKGLTGPFSFFFFLFELKPNK
jgi:hypothetical protein